MSTSADILSDDEVQALLEKRAFAREQGDFAEADGIRESLLWDGIVLQSESDGQVEWRRLPLALLGRSGQCGCLAWMRKREEFCGQPVHGARTYFCSEHQKLHKGRVPCPLDPKHTITIAKLPGHLRVCQGVVIPPSIASLRDSPLDSFAGDSGISDAVAQVKQKVPIPVGAADTELDELADLACRILGALWDCGAVTEVSSSEDDNEFDINRIVEVASKRFIESETERPLWMGRRLHLRPRPVEIMLPDSCAPLVSRAPPEGNRKARNGHHDVLQQASIAGHLDRAGWVPLSQGESSSQTVNAQAHEDVCLVEFGAGSAHLSGLIAQVSKRPIGWHMLIDRQANRRTADERLRQGKSQQDVDGDCSAESIARGATVERMQCDICNLDLNLGLSNMRAKSNCDDKDLSVVAVGKHICGVATDLSMRCCIEASSSSTSPSEKLATMAPVKFRGLAFALCCHHVCEWSRYVGQDWLRGYGFDESDFNSMRWFAKLAHTQYRQRQHDNYDLPEEEYCRICESQSLSARAAAVRAELGHLCKRLIDEGRSAWLLQQGWQCRLVRFCDREVSPENGLLLAWPRETG